VVNHPPLGIRPTILVNCLFIDTKRYKPAAHVRNIGRGEIVSYTPRVRSLFVTLVLCALTSVPVFAQMETATLTGAITDPNGRVVPDVEVAATRIETGTVATTKTNGAGIYFFTGLMPGHYHLMIHKPGFKEIAVKEIQLNVQDKLEQNFSLEIGSVSETVTVNANDLHINTTDATVSTVVDRQFAENLPLNGRSFQTLIQLTPGVVLTPNNGTDTGQFSVDGQRATSNYWMVDGVSANIGIGTLPSVGQGFGGALGSTSVLGGTNSLVSVDALEEFRIQTSTYAPEFGRTPGAQISIVTRSGTNQFHGTMFDYLRNDVLDANNWFADEESLPKPKERQNDFGGTFSGAVSKDRTFFFFSYEGLRLRLPQVEESFVPDVTARQNAVPAIQPFLNAYPLPNGASGTDDLSTGVGQFNASFSNPGTLDAYSVRIDHRLNDKINIFGRYNYSPSELIQRGFASSLSSVSPAKIVVQTGTVGVTWSISSAASNDFRFNISNTDATSSSYLDNFGNAVPLTELPFPNPFTSQNARLSVIIFSLGSGPSGSGALVFGKTSHNQQRQINVVDSMSVQRGSHQIKFGIDFRRMTPRFDESAYQQQPLFASVPQAETGNPMQTDVISELPATFLFRNLGVFAQDTWRIVPRLTLTYGLRWDVDFAPSSISGPNLPAVTGFNLNDLSSLALAPVGTPPFSTPYGNIAPRIGVAYQVSPSQDWQTVLRGGFGVFYDLATAEAGNLVFGGAYPFEGLVIDQGSFPLSSSAAASPPVSSPALGIAAFDPHLKLPYTLEWNVAVEQALGKQQTITASYIGSVGRRLMQTAAISAPNPNFGFAELVTNAVVSDYQALQVQFQRRLSRGLQALASYTWSHSIDTASAGSLGSGSNALPALNPNANRGPSDFDIRNAFSMGLTYEVPSPKVGTLASTVLKGWSTENIFQARSAPPVDTYYSLLGVLSNGFFTNVRPDVVPEQPFYLIGSQCVPPCPGGKEFNPAAFTTPPLDPVTGLPLRQGDLPRNALRGFGAYQWDFAVHRDFPIRESLKLQFRAEMFNVLNHPNFGPPIGDLGFPGALNPQFGQSIQTLGQSLSGAFGAGSGGFNPLYQVGGPRSIQFALKLQF
jgi:hypothetical protein